MTLSLRHRSGLEIRAAAENLLPGWGRGGERRLSLLLRLRRRFLLSATSQCGGPSPAAATQPVTPPRSCRVVRFLRSRWARLTKPRVASIWRRKKQPPARVAAAAAAVPRDSRDLQRSRTLTRLGFWAMAWTPKSAATLRFVFVAAALLAIVVAIVTAFPITGGLSNRWVKFLGLLEHQASQSQLSTETTSVCLVRRSEYWSGSSQQVDIPSDASHLRRGYQWLELTAS